MTEKQKMLDGKLYNAMSDPQLIKERQHCKTLCFNYNNLNPSDTPKRGKVIKKLFGKTKDSFLIEPNLWCDYGYNIEIGENFYSNHNLVILDCAKVTFGDNVLIGPNCGFYAATHPTDPISRNKGEEYAIPISIGNNVWIGGGVTVLPGVSIGDNCVIGGGSVVAHSIPENSIAVGNPCKVIRKI